MTIFTSLLPDTMSNYLAYKGFTNVRYFDIGTPRMDNVSKLFGIIPDYGIFSKEATQDWSGPLFDAEYAAYLTEGPGFLSLITMAAQEYYRGDILWVYFYPSGELMECIIDDLIRLLFGRYGIESSIVNDVEDLIYLDLNNSLSINGLNIISADIERAMSISPNMIKEIELRCNSN